MYNGVVGHIVEPKTFVKVVVKWSDPDTNVCYINSKNIVSIYGYKRSKITNDIEYRLDLMNGNHIIITEDSYKDLINRLVNIED